MLATAGGSAWLAAVGLWLADALGAGLPAAVDGTVAGLAVLAAGVGLAVAVRRLWTSGTPGRTLLAVVALACVTSFTGLAQEVVGRTFGDEGIYLAQARRINRGGMLLRPWFIYPHLLFYLDAFALWLASALGPVAPFLARVLYGVERVQALEPLITRTVTAAMGAGTVVPVFVAARRVAGPVAAGLAGGLIAFCPLFVRVAHLNISDVAGAFFAALTLMECARLVDGESRRGYVLAGLWSGLAAGGKYPAGVAAVAVAGVWLGRRLGRRGVGLASEEDGVAQATPWGLLWAALASIAAFLATTPSFLAFPEAVFRGEGTDVLFGFRQYAQAGWTGVVRASNAGYYLGQILRSFGLPAVALGLTGIAGLAPRSRRRLLWLLPFPVAYLALMLAMRVAVARNLLPVLPALAVILGAGAVGWVRILERRLGSRSAILALVTGLCLALPAWRSTEQTVRFSRPTTRELAAAWIPEHLPPGSALVQEAYTPVIQPEHLYPATRRRFVVRLSPEELRDPRFDFVFLASGAYGRFFRTEDFDARSGPDVAARYETIFRTFEPVAEWTPGRFRSGPVLRLVEVDPERPPWSATLVRSADELLTASPGMRPDTDGPVVFDGPGGWALAKGYLEPGRYRVTIEGEISGEGGGVEVRTRAGEEIDVDLLFGDDTARVSLPRRDKYFVYVRLPGGSTLRAVRLERIAPQPSPTPPGAEAPPPATSP